MTAYFEDLRYYSYREIGEQAEAFLKKHGRFDTLPVDIEAIADMDLRLNIIEVPNLRDVIGVEGYISSDLKDITIDISLYERYRNRFRFTLAHEVGHFVLHPTIYRQFSFKSMEEWKSWNNELSEDHRYQLERQAQDFAGHLLVPTQHLKQRLSAVLPRAEEKMRECKRLGLPENDALDNAIGWIADQISPDFEVASIVVEIRLKKGNMI